MKKTLAIVLALAMVLCMIPATFAATTTTKKNITDKSYNVNVEVYKDAKWEDLGEKTQVNSYTASYDYEKLGSVVTGKWEEDKVMGLVTVDGFDPDLAGLPKTDVVVTVDGKELKVDGIAAYEKKVGFDSGKVTFPVELTKAGYSDTETAKISVTFKNTASYKTAKTATVTAVKSVDSKIEAYIVGSKIYLDCYDNGADYANAKTFTFTFGDENGKAFSVVTWAYNPSENGADLAFFSDEQKLVNSAATFTYKKAANQNVTFKLETKDAIYSTKKYNVVVRTGLTETDPKGIYFAESTKTIKRGESYTPVVMGVATGKKVNATLAYGKTADESNKVVSAEIVDIDGSNVIGTKPGVAYITAEYTTVDGGVKYTASSMKIIVTEAEAEETASYTTYYVTCRNLNVRKGAGTSYAKAGMVHRGDALKVVSISKNWAKLADGTFVSAKYISK